ncbi:MAG: extracellular solute-binding protein [Anaerolineae bacterium]
MVWKFKLSLLMLLLTILVSGTASAQSFEPVDLVIWARDGSTAQLLSLWFDQWAEEHAPGSTLQLVSLRDADLNNQLLTAYPSDLPDIVVDDSEPLAGYANAGLLMPLDGVVDTSVYDSAVVAGAQVDGTTYGIPLSSGGHLMMIINTQLVGSAPQTFDEAAANGLLFPIEDPRYLLPIAFGFGGSVMDGSGNFTLDSSAWADAMAFMQQLAGSVPSGCDVDCTDGRFINGDVGVVIADDTSLAMYLDRGMENNIAVAPFPTLPNGQRAHSFVSTEYASLSINATGSKFDAALAFLTWVTTDANVVLNAASTYGRLPSAVSLQNDSTISSSSLLSTSLEVYQDGVMLPATTHTSCLWDALGTAWSSVLAGALSPADAAASAQQAAATCAANIG